MNEPKKTEETPNHFCQNPESMRQMIHEEVPQLLATALTKLFWRIIRWVGFPIGSLLVGLIIMWVNVSAHLEDGHPNRVEEVLEVEHDRISRLETELEIWRGAGMPLLLVQIKADLDNLKSATKEMKDDVKALRNGSE